MAAFLDECNRTSVIKVFVNDVNSKDEMEKKRKDQKHADTEALDAVAAAKQAEEARVSREKALVQQLKDAREKIEELEVKRKELEKSVKQGTDSVQELNSQLAQSNSRISSIQNEAEAKLASEKRAALDGCNNLPLDWDWKLVTFINASSMTALECKNGKSTE